MAATDSRHRSGTLTLGDAPAVAFACQATNVRITPTHEEDGDRTEVLCGDVLPPVKSRTDVLAIVAVQDFTDPDGFIAYTWTNDLAQVPFTWAPAGAAGPTYAGTVEVLAVEVGGDVGVRLTTETEWNVVGPVDVTYPEPPPLGALADDAGDAAPVS